MSAVEWLLCPVCQSKTRTMVREDTVLQNFPLFCLKCKQQILVDVEKLHMTVIKEPEVVLVLGAMPPMPANRI